MIYQQHAYEAALDDSWESMSEQGEAQADGEDEVAVEDVIEDSELELSSEEAPELREVVPSKLQIIDENLRSIAK